LYSAPILPSLLSLTCEVSRARWVLPACITPRSSQLPVRAPSRWRCIPPDARFCAMPECRGLVCRTENTVYGFFFIQVCLHLRRSLQTLLIVSLQRRICSVDCEPGQFLLLVQDQADGRSSTATGMYYCLPHMFFYLLTVYSCRTSWCVHCITRNGWRKTQWWYDSCSAGISGRLYLVRR